MLEQGYYANTAMFPAVPVSRTGLRFTVSNHTTRDQIDDFVGALGRAYHSISEIGRGPQGGPSEPTCAPPPGHTQSALVCEESTQISSEWREDWDRCFAGRGNFDWSCLALMERSFSGHASPELNWKFHYVLIRDRDGVVVLATYFTLVLLKDDMLDSAALSQAIEAQRKSRPYHLCSTTLMMGSILSEGEHLFLREEHPLARNAIEMLCSIATRVQNLHNANTIFLRDFGDAWQHSDIFYQWGYSKVALPNSNRIFALGESPNQDYVEILPASSRYHIRKHVLAHQVRFDFSAQRRLSTDELEQSYALCRAMSQRITAINIFDYPWKLFEEINQDEDWEFGLLHERSSGSLMAVLVSHCAHPMYSSILIGYESFKSGRPSVYRQITYRCVLHARNAGYETMHLGLSSDYENRRLGATQQARHAFVSVADSFNRDTISAMVVPSSSR